MNSDAFAWNARKNTSVIPAPDTMVTLSVRLPLLVFAMDALLLSVRVTLPLLVAVAVAV